MKTIILLALMMAFAQVAFADSKSDGCGLGWEVTSRESFLGTTTRGTTNMTVPPTFGMTSGTLGCAKHDFAKKDVEAVIFADVNFEALKMDMASGSGEYLTGFARTMGCSDAVVGEFSRTMQKSFAPSSNGIEMFKKAKSDVQANPVLALGCNA